MMKKYKEVSFCRLCQHSTELVFQFGETPLANAFKNSENNDEVFPLSYFKCNNCHSVQLAYELDSKDLFKEYLYESPPNLIPHFKELSQKTSSFLDLKNKDIVLDIGSNNGLLLKEYKNLGFNVLGIEPALNIASKARQNGIPTLNNFFTKGLAQNLLADLVFPRLITSTNCFAHLSDLNDFVDGLSILMDDDSYFVFENAYLLDTLNNLDFGQAYFEHYYMHSIFPLQKLFEKHGLELFRIEYNNVQMGSIRGYVRTKNNKKIPMDNSVKNGIIKELENGLFTLNKYQNFMKQIKDKREKFVNFLMQNKDKKIAIYGWPAKMTLLNSFWGIEEYIDYIIEESSLKVGKYAPGTKLQIKDINYFGENPPHICIVGAYNFFNDIIKKNSWYEGNWINPLL